MSNLTCSVETCKENTRSAGMCGTHHSRKLNGKPLIRLCKKCGLGDVKTKHGYHDECQPKVCEFCECAPVVKPHSNVCSYVCRARLKRGSKKTAECTRCGDEVDLSETGKAGRRKRSDTSMCGPCKRAHSTRHKVSVSVLAKLWGTTCNVCDEEIDLTLKYPDQFRASVDHEIPYSLGGSHDLENLRLAHLWCNNVKHDRQGFKI